MFEYYNYCLWFMVLLVLFFVDFSAEKERLFSMHADDDWGFRLIIILS